MILIPYITYIGNPTDKLAINNIIKKYVPNIVTKVIKYILKYNLIN